MRSMIGVAIALLWPGVVLGQKCEKIDDPAGYSYVECDPAKIKAAKEEIKAGAAASPPKPATKPGWAESVEEFTARMAVENAKSEVERSAAQAQAESVRKEEDRKRAVAAKERAAMAARADAEFRRAVDARSIGAWRYRMVEDKMSGGSIKAATTFSTNQVEFAFPYQGRQRAKLELRVHPRHGREVIFSIEKGQLLCRHNDCGLLVRFGDGKPQAYAAVGSADLSTEILFIRDADRFVAALRKATAARIQAKVYQQGNPVFDFDVADLRWPFGN